LQNMNKTNSINAASGIEKNAQWEWSHRNFSVKFQKSCAYDWPKLNRRVLLRSDAIELARFFIVRIQLFIRGCFILSEKSRHFKNANARVLNALCVTTFNGNTKKTNNLYYVCKKLTMLFCFYSFKNNK